MSVAQELLDAAVRDEQIAHRVALGEDVSALRAEIRRLARQRRIRIRTGLIDGDVLVVVLTNARIWYEGQTTMRHKLTPPT